jgi:type I restriction enzyme M protein
VALKKSELYSSLWSSCDELRGGMDASQYKDYVLVLLFIKYVSDKYSDVPYAPIIIPEGASFKDMVALKGKPDIGDQINKKIIAPLANANKLSDMPDFNDATKLGSGKEMVDRLTNLVAIFENPALDFSKNRADGDDILGDATLRHRKWQEQGPVLHPLPRLAVSWPISSAFATPRPATIPQSMTPPAGPARCC